MHARTHAHMHAHTHTHTYTHTQTHTRTHIKVPAIPTLVVAAFRASVAAGALKLFMRRFTTSTLPEIQAACTAVSPEDFCFLGFCMEKRDYE